MSRASYLYVPCIDRTCIIDLVLPCNVVQYRDSSRYSRTSGARLPEACMGAR